MASLLAKDAYLQGLARKICCQPSPEPQKRKSASKTQGSEAAGPPKKKRKKAQKKSREREKAVELKTQALGEKSPASSRDKKPAVPEEGEAFSSMGSPADGDVEQGQLRSGVFCSGGCLRGHSSLKRWSKIYWNCPADTLVTELDSLFALDVVRQRLHEKMREARGQVSGEAAGVQGAVWFPAVVSLLCLEEKVPWCSLWGWLPALPAIVGLTGGTSAAFPTPVAGPARALAALFGKRSGVVCGFSGSLHSQRHLPCMICAGLQIPCALERGSASSLWKAAFAEHTRQHFCPPKCHDSPVS
ncbi:surfeit locus protein 6 isoform X1 [Leptonychotes weddellii]|uniref:Surfeit locus protein 6 isoform X1 n=1 Tax=Leptonychotes weddellii TaxID=9713 RepID=A0A7F8RR04_LEPWE|nr:surfeit locus protein 6 isoform X1 [Leptonychotes weddellii]